MCRSRSTRIGGGGAAELVTAKMGVGEMLDVVALLSMLMVVIKI